MWMFQPRTQKKVISVIARWKGEKSISYWLFPDITLEASESNFLSFLSGRYLMADSARLHKEQQLGASQLLAGNKDRVRRGASVALSARLHSRAGLQRDCSAPQILASKCQDVAGSLCLTTCLDRVTFTGAVLFDALNGVLVLSRAQTDKDTKPGGEENMLQILLAWIRNIKYLSACLFRNEQRSTCTGNMAAEAADVFK